VAGFAVPDTDGGALDAVLSAELAHVAGVLCDLHLLDLLTERGTVTGTVLSGNSDLLCALGHFGGCDGVTEVVEVSMLSCLVGCVVGSKIQMLSESGSLAA